MYQAYWNLSQRPFENGASPGFYFPSPSHQASLLKFRYLIEQQKGLGLIVGEHGLGKTFLTHVIEHECSSEKIGPFIRLVIPALNASESLAYFAHRLGAENPPHQTGDQILLSLEARLRTLKAEKQHPVLIVDDAHLLSLEQLNLIRLLLNVHEGGIGSFSLILSGRTELLARIKKLPALDQRVAVRMALQPLDETEVLKYVRHRLETAGAANDFFDESAAESVFELSQGVPRRINQICDLALLVGFVDRLKTISSLEVETAADEILCVKD